MKKVHNISVDCDLGPPRAWYVTCSREGRILFEDGSGFSSKADAKKLALAHARKHRGSKVRINTPPEGF